MAARSEDKAKEAIAKIKFQVPNAKITFLKLDLQDLKQVQQAAKEFALKESVLDTLINNAGIMIPPFALTSDGIETQFGTNHVGHFLFTRELLPLLLKSSEPRIVNLSSLAHKFAPKIGIDFDRINDQNAYTTNTRYGQSKLANILFSNSLTSKYPSIYTNSVHPGVVNTDLFRSVKDSLGVLYYPAWPILKAVEKASMSPIEGALTSLYCATSADIVQLAYKGRYFIPFAVEAQPSDIAKSQELAEKLWVFTEKLVNEKLGL